jgi:hypothetical protein
LVNVVVDWRRGNWGSGLSIQWPRSLNWGFGRFGKSQKQFNYLECHELLSSRFCASIYRSRGRGVVVSWNGGWKDGTSLERLVFSKC